MLCIGLRALAVADRSGYSSGSAMCIAEKFWVRWGGLETLNPMGLL